MLTMHSTMSGTITHDGRGKRGHPTAMGKAFDAANNDDSFYLPPEVFNNADFQAHHEHFPVTGREGLRVIDFAKGRSRDARGRRGGRPDISAAEEALKGTPLEDAKIYLAGTAASVKDMVDGPTYDLLIAGVSALCLIFIIMLLMTEASSPPWLSWVRWRFRSGASFGLSCSSGNHLVGMQMDWVVLAMSVIVLLAVGSDYNLLLVSRMKEEIAAGINTGIIRAMGGTGRVVTAAGLVFAATMASMLVSDLLTLGQLGATIGLGLLFDTLVVRAFMTPSIAALLGRWFWWPQRVRPRPASALLRPVGPRPLVRSLLLRD